MKVIFLDIDGVLNTNKWIIHQYHKNGFRIASPSYYFQPSCVKQLKRIVLNTSAKIVISSTWRLLPDEISVISANFVWHGLNPINIIGSTPFLLKGNEHCQRGDEIYQWLETYNNNVNNTDKVSNYIILDDDSDMGELMPKLIKCNRHIGLTKKNADIAIKLLNN